MKVPDIAGEAEKAEKLWLHISSNSGEMLFLFVLITAIIYMTGFYSGFFFDDLVRVWNERRRNKLDR